MKRIFFLLLIIASYTNATGQVFPVQATTQLSRPYSLYLSDYTAPGSERISLNIFLTDVSRTELNIRLRLRIEGQGIKLETKGEFMPPPLTLHGGVPLQLISADLADYFDPKNLNFTGISQREFEQRGALPEGLYQFCFEVLEYNRGVKISNSGCATAWLILNDPPLINLPAFDSKIRIQSPQQVIFQWTPRHTGSPNAAFSTEYDFKLVEVWPSSRNPNDAILTSPPIFETTTSASTLIYGPAETALEPGRRYAFQIKARSITGVEELNLFKNNGLSQVSTFVYGDACMPPDNIVYDLSGPTKFDLRWDEGLNQTGYTIKYRIAGMKPEASWYSSSSITPDVTINSLNPDTRYEYQVAATCGFLESAYSPIFTLTTKPKSAVIYSCGLPAESFVLDASQLLDALNVGDMIQAGDYDVKITKVSGSNGIFSGEGVIEFSYFNSAKVKAEFTGIAVNKEKRMVNGAMNVTGAGVDLIPGGVRDFMDQLSELANALDSVTVKKDVNEDFDVNSFVADKLIVIPGTILSVTKGSDGAVTVSTADGKTQTLPAGTLVALTDSAGKGYLVDKNGNIQQTTAAVALKAANRQYNLSLTFSENPQQRFGFDAMDRNIKNPIADTYVKVNEDYLPWKSVASGQTDPVVARLKDNAIDKTRIHFEQRGETINPQFQNGAAQLNVTGTIGGEMEGLMAIYAAADTTEKDQVIGQVNVVSYDEIVKSVVIVPVNVDSRAKVGSASALQFELNKIYGSAIVKWEVKFADNVLMVPNVDPFDDGSSGLLSNYTKDMRDVIKAYEPNITPGTYYLFLITNPKSKEIQGYMPRSKNSGFIYVDIAQKTIIKTIAHELGHGAFNLHHTFSDQSHTMAQGSTNNLMDYADSTKLYKYQWDKIRNLEIVIGLFEGDDEGAYISESPVEQVARIINSLNCGYQNHSETIDIHYGSTRYEVSLGKLASLLNPNNPILASEEFKNARLIMWIGGYSITEPLSSYNDISLNLNGYKYEAEEKLIIPGNEGALGFAVSSVNFRSPLKKSDVFNWLIKMIDRNSQSPSLIRVDNSKPLEINDLKMFSQCELSQLTIPNRTKALSLLVDSQEAYKIFDLDTYQYLLINVLKSTPQAHQSSLYSELIKNPRWILYPYEVMALPQRGKYVEILYDWWKTANGQHPHADDHIVINYSIFGNPNNLIEDKNYTELVFKTKGLHTKEVDINETVLATLAPLDALEMSFKNQQAEKRATVVPAIFVKYLIDRGGYQDMKDIGWTTLNAASFVVGVGEVTIGIQTARNGALALGILRGFLGAANAIADIRSIYCTQARSSETFCNALGKYELFLAVGLMTASSADVLYSQLAKGYSEVPPGFFKGSQKEFLEGELKLLDATIVNSVNLFSYTRLRGYLGDSEIAKTLTGAQSKRLENALQAADPKVLEMLNDMNFTDFAEVVRGFKDEIKTVNALTGFEVAVGNFDLFANTERAWLKNWKLAPKMRDELDFLQTLKSKFEFPTGNATDIQLASIHGFTIDGNFLNSPMRYQPTWLGAYREKALKHVVEGLAELRKVPQRNMKGRKVFSGKAYSLDGFNATFLGKAGSELPYAGFISSSIEQSVAEGFIEITSKTIASEKKVGVILRILTQEGVFIDDISDWGKNLGPKNHSDEPLKVRVQHEVLMNEGYLKQTSEPIPVMENGIQMRVDGIPYYYVDFLELVKPLK